MKGLYRISSTLFLFLALNFLAGCVSESKDNRESPLGINLTGLHYWQTDWKTVDVMKQSGAWLTSCDGCTWDTQESESLDLDSQGYPRTLPSANDTVHQYRYVRTVVFHDDEGHHQHGQYTVLYEGEGDLRFEGAPIISSAPGRTVIDVGPGSLFLVIRSTDPNNTGNHLRNIRIIRPGGICDNDNLKYAESAEDCSGQYQAFTDVYSEHLFHPYFLKDLSHFSTLRGMGMVGTVGDYNTTWSQRAKFDYRTWAKNGAPSELVLDMANAVGADAWLNVPARADDDYVQRFAEMALSRLGEKQFIYLEYSNEVWNTAYPYNINGAWIEGQAEAQWPNSTDHSFTKRLNWYGKRTAEVCGIWKDVFGDKSDRVRCVMGGQGGNSWTSDTSLSCPLWAAESGENCATQMYGLNIGLYFAGYFANEPLIPYFSEWASLADGGLDNVFNEINNGILFPLTNTPGLPDWQQPAPEGGAFSQTALAVADKAVADKFGLNLLAYEGGQHITYAGNLTGDRAVINEMFMAANRDSRMGDAMTTLLHQWKDVIGGDLFVVFESTGGWGAWGAFPVKEYQLQPLAETPKFEALLDFIDDNPCWWEGCKNSQSDTGGGSGTGDGTGDGNSGNQPATSMKVFNVGHSLIGAQNMPFMIQQITSSLGDSYDYSNQILNGSPLKWNWDHGDEGAANARESLPTGEYDVLVITEAVPLQNHLTWSDTFEYASRYYNLAIEGNPDTRVYLYETWHCITSGVTQCPYDNNNDPWRQRLTSDKEKWQSIVDFVNENNSGPDMKIIPAGQAMAALYDAIVAGEVPGIDNIELLFEDDIHPNEKGAYFVAMVHYATIYERDPTGSARVISGEYGQPYDAFTEEQLTVLQRIVWDVVSNTL